MGGGSGRSDSASLHILIHLLVTEGMWGVGDGWSGL